MSRTQLRAKSGASTETEKETVVEEIVPAGVSGSVQITADRTGTRIRFCCALFCDGTAGVFCGVELFFSAQQGIMPPCWQHAVTVSFAHTGKGVCASRNGVPASTKLQMMVSTNFIVMTVTLFGRFS